MSFCESIAFMEEISKTISASSAAPPFTWGKGGNVAKNTYLLNESVPSNTAGRVVYVNGLITVLVVAADIPSTATIEIKRNVLGVFTTIYSYTILNVRKVTVVLPSPVVVNQGDELACFISGASIKNPVIGAIVTGTI